MDWNDGPLQRWLNTIVKDGTKYNYRSAFRAYHQYTGITATQLIDEALEDAKRDVRERKDVVLTRLIGFYHWLKNDYEVKSRGTGKHRILGKGVSDKLADARVSAIRSFYATFDIVIRLRGRRRLPKPKVRNKRMKVGAEQVKTLVDHARTPRDKAVILTMFQSGMDVSTLCSLKYGDVAEGLVKNDHPLKLELYRPKTGVEHYTFLGKDAVDALKVYIKDAETRGVKFSNNSPLLVTEKGKEPVDTNNVQNMLREVAVKSGLVDEKMNGNAFNPLSPHALRESFGSLMINSGVPDTIVDFWLGHEIGAMAEAYKSVQHESLRKMYLEREKLISISQPAVDLEEVEKKVRAEIEEKNKQLQTLVNSLAIENQNLKGRIEKVEERDKKVQAEIEAIKKIIEELLHKD